MPTWLAAGLWGLIAGGALVVGATIAWWVRVPPQIIAGIMAFGAGVLIPKSVVLGVSLIGGAAVSPAVLTAIFISNVPEGLSSAAGMKQAHRSAGYVFGVWGGIAVASGLASLIGYLAL